MSKPENEPVHEFLDRIIHELTGVLSEDDLLKLWCVRVYFKDEELN